MTREEREKVIRILDDMKVKIDIPKAAIMQNDKNWALDMAIKALKQESRKGHWVIKDNMWWVCSACGCQTRMMKKYNVPNFCPACGAKMVEPQESDIEKPKPCINCEDGCEEWAGCPCVYYKADSEG